MEEIEKIKAFLADIGSGYGYGSGNGYGYGSGNGSGYGYGYGSGNGSGYGYGNGYGSGNGSGNGSGYGYGYGYGNGNGNGNGSGCQIRKYNNDVVFYVDGVPTIFGKIKGNVAHVRVVNEYDWQTKNGFVVKGYGRFAHGETLDDARESLREKVIAEMSTEERITQFIKTFNGTDRYPAKTFFNWHSLLTGSCLMGRKAFVESNHISLEKDYTVKEFIGFCENAYGGEVIRRVKRYYE